MVTSISDREPQLNQAASTVTGETVRFTVTGLDENGQMFREAAPILNLNGRDCSFRSKFQPEVGSWMLIEIDLSKQGSKRSTLQGQVRSVQAEGVATNLFQVRVELESAQDVKIESSAQKTQSSAPEVPPKAVPESKKESEGKSKAVPATAPAAMTDVSDEKTISEVPTPVLIKQSLPASPVVVESATQSPLADTASLDRDNAKSAIASEVQRQLAGLKASFSQELEQMIQRTASSGIEQVVRQAIEKQITVSYESAIETLNSDLSYQLVGRLASSEELRASIEKMAKEILEKQIEVSRNSAIEAQRTLNAQVKEISRSFETSMADMVGRLKVARESVTAVLDRVQALEKEAADGTLNLQTTVEQLNQSARSTIEKFDAHVTAQLNSWSAQFKKHLDDVSRDKSTIFAADLQQQLAPSKQEANELMEKLSAGLQLAQGTLRMQEEQVAGLSRAAATEIEKEIKAVLLRMAGIV